MPTLSPKRDVAPKYLELAEELRALVRSGQLQPGERLPSFAEMRRQHDISRGTVEKIHEVLERDGLVVREQGRGTFVANGKPRERTGFIGFCGWGFAKESHSPYWMHLLEGIQETASRQGKRIVLMDYHSTTGWDSIDGALFADSDPHMEHEKNVPRSLPRVSLLYPMTGVASVAADDFQGGLLATEHLLALGHRRIACLETADNPLTRRRLAGYRSALTDAGIVAQPQWVRSLEVGFPLAMFRENGAAAMRQWLQEDWSETACTAILAQNDLAAAGIIDALKEYCLDVPGDVSVVGFDATEANSEFSPRLTTVEVPLREIGKIGLEILLQQIDSGSRTALTLIPTRLVVRESTCRPHEPEARQQ